MLVADAQFRATRDALMLFEWYNNLPEAYEQVWIGEGEQISEPDEEVSLPRGIVSKVPESLCSTTICQYVYQSK